MRPCRQLVLVALMALLMPPNDADAQSGDGVPDIVQFLSPEALEIDALLSMWQYAQADEALQRMRTSKPGAPEVLYLEGYALFLQGDYKAAVAKLNAIQTGGKVYRNVIGLRQLASAADAAIEGHAEKRSQNFVIRYPPEDDVLVDPALDALEAAVEAFREDLGFSPQWPIPVDIYRSAEDLAAVSPLTVAEVERTGTIALCKWGRLMATSPRALRFGYPWLDTLSHELVHYAISSLTHDRTPVWLHEGLAKFLERRWRGPVGKDLPPSMEHLLAKALRRNKLISFDAMHPSMAKLPSSEDATLAFAEVGTAIAFLHEQGGNQALRETLARIDGGEDARQAVATTLGMSWRGFDRRWRSFMRAQKFKTFPHFEPIKPQLRDKAAMGSKRAPTEDEHTALLPDEATQML